MKSNGKNIEVLDSTSFRLISTLKGHTKRVSWLGNLPGENIVTASDDDTIKIWNYANGNLKYTLNSAFNGHRDAITCFGALGNNLLASGARDGSVKLWRIL